MVVGRVPDDALWTLLEARDAKPEPRLSIKYPSDRVRIPENVAPLRFRLEGDPMPMAMKEPAMGPMEGAKAGAEVRVYELRFEADGERLRVFATEPAMQVPDQRWSSLLAHARDGEISVVGRALLEDGHVLTTKPIHVLVAAPIPQGVARYASGTDNQARQGAIDTAWQDGTIQTTDYPTLTPWESAARAGDLVATADGGMLSIRAGQTDIALAWSRDYFIETPSWSPDGDWLVFAARALEMEPMMPAGPDMPGAMELSGIFRVSVGADTAVGTPQRLLTADKPDSFLRAPSFSPDGGYLAFEQGKGADKTGKLSLMASDGAQEAALSTKEWKGDGAYPTWLPSAEDGESWLVFSQPRSDVDDGRDADHLQLWMLSLRARDGAPPEPAGEPFWLPLQSADEDNRRLLFTQD